MASWCDKLASTPSVGLKVDPHFGPSEAILAAVAPILGRFAEGDKQRFTIDRQDSFSLVFSTEDGKVYSCEPGKVSVQFKHRMKAKPMSAGPPVMEMISTPAPFSELLPEVSASCVEVALGLPFAGKRSAHRVGIVATTVVAEEDMPPGVRRFVRYMGRPWKGDLASYSIQIAAIISRSEKHTDRCVYTIVRPEDEEQLTSFIFDWQRDYSTGIPLRQSALTDELKRAQVGALEYFERVAEGDEWDEEQLSIAAITAE